MNQNEQAMITEAIPKNWKQLENIVTAILAECGMTSRRNVKLDLPRGTVDVDVYAEETVSGIVHRTICECKNWSTRVPKAVVHSFRTVMAETGANRGYIISKNGFQAGAIEAAISTNIELVTFQDFQKQYFEKWIAKRIWDVENLLDGFHVYYEPLGRPGYSQLTTDEERTAYDTVWNKYYFAGIMLQFFSPYTRLMGVQTYASLPFDCTALDEQNIFVPEEIRNVSGYRELLHMLEKFGIEGRTALRAVNPITRGKPEESILNDD